MFPILISCLFIPSVFFFIFLLIRKNNSLQIRKIQRLNDKEEHNKRIRILLKRRGNRKICDDDYIQLINFIEKKPYLKNKEYNKNRIHDFKNEETNKETSGNI